MTNKELLEYAAKSIGLVRTYYYWDLSGEWGMISDRIDGGLWNPLISDADAFQLATRLEMTVDFCKGKVKHGQIEVDFEAQMPLIDAARKAIVQTAAEIGKNIDD